MPGAQERHSAGAVLVLRTLVLHDDDGARRQMGDAHRGFGLVDMLAAGALRAHRVDLQVRLVDVDIDLLGFGQDRDGSRRGMDTPLRLGFRHALHPMHAEFEFQLREDAASRDLRDDFLEAARRPSLATASRRASLSIRRALIHPEKVAGEKGRLVAAGPGANFENGVLFIRRVLWQKRDFQLVLEIK